MATTTKKPTAAELARREAQSAKDKGEAVTVTVDGVTVTLNVDDLDDYDLIRVTNSGNPEAFLALCFPDEEDPIDGVKALRDEGGKLKLSTIMQWIQHVLEAAGQGNS